MMTGKGGEEEDCVDMLGWRQVTPRWSEDPLRRQEVEDDGGDGTHDVSRRVRGELISVRNNKQLILGPEWFMSEVGTSSPNNSDKQHRPVDIVNNNNNICPIYTPRICGIRWKLISI